MFDLMEDWTEKYRPKNLNEIIGNKNAIKELIKWGSEWTHGIPKKRAIILSGNPGTGKTSSAIALANDYNWSIIELNTSDARNAIKIKKIATIGAINETFDNNGNFVSSNNGGRKLIILDEADNLYEKIKGENSSDLSDKGGKKAIIETIKISMQPIILIVNNYYDLIKGSGESLKNLCKLIKFYNPYTNSVVNLLKKICILEKINIDFKVLNSIAERSQGDIRSAINDLQSICIDKEYVDIESLKILGERDKKEIIFNTIRDVFKKTNLKQIRDSVFNLDENPNSVILWINENLPNEYKDFNDLVKGYNALSLADIMLGRVHKRQYYGLWSYASDIMCGGVAFSKTHNYVNEKYFFPQWLREIKSRKTNQNIRDSIVEKISLICHNSKSKGRKYFNNYFKHILRNNFLLNNNLHNNLNLNENEIKYIIGMNYNKKIRGKELISSDKINMKNNEKDKDKNDKKQQSLFDF
jgi:replication factor C large subunit